MYSKNHNVSLVILYILFVIIYSILGDTLLNRTNARIEVLNKRIDELKTVNADYTLRIENMKRQIAVYTYNLENKELKDKTDSDKKEIKKVSVKKPIQKYKNSDLTLLAQLIESESGNQSVAGKMAVGTVVMNRVNSGVFPDTIRGVIFQKHQFSPVANGTINNKPSAESLEVAKKIMEGSRVLKSNVLYFYNPKISTDKWIETRTVNKTIGDHVFVS